MNLVIQGILLGLFLAIMLGPIFVTITQIAVEKGARAGLTACLGIWVSDFIIIGLSFFFVKRILQITEDATFTYWMGLFGGFILVVFGIGALLKETHISFEKQTHSANDYISFWSKGFLVNTVNPFTFIFWIGVMSANVIDKNLTNTEVLIFFGTIMLVIMATDSFKVFLAKKIRTKLTQNHFKWFSRIAGIGLILFGIAFLIRSDVL